MHRRTAQERKRKFPLRTEKLMVESLLRMRIPVYTLTPIVILPNAASVLALILHVREWQGSSKGAGGGKQGGACFGSLEFGYNCLVLLQIRF
jgi:hypothetical protein